MVVMRWPVADCLHPLSALELQPYRDAGYSRADYHLHPQPILYGVHRALKHNLLDLSTFDLAAYEHAEKVETGDWNWITPGFVAFASPVEAGWSAGGGGGGGGAGTGSPRRGGGASSGPGGKVSRAFRNVLDEFESKNVKVVVRLNKKLYDAAHFAGRGIDHVEMYFDDGTNPTLDMCRRFIDLSDRVISEGGAVAVHCKAGLGRTGTLIGAYLIYKHGFTADEAIGFMRLMRPGSCVGPQQHFLYENQLEWVRWAAQDELRRELASQNGLAGQALAAASASARPRSGSDPSSAPAATAVNAERSTSGGSAEPARPITPPNEADLAAARARSSTPGRDPSLAPVTPRRPPPGQPRKTPGRSRHAYAEPETAPESVGKSAAEIEEERMEGVVMSSPRKARTSSGAGTVTAPNEGKDAKDLKGKGKMLAGSGAGGDYGEDDGEDDPLMRVSPKKLDLGGAGTTSKAAPPPASPTNAGSIASTRPKTPSATTTRPTRIARPARPLSALADNRIVDRIGTSSSSSITRASTRAGAAHSNGSGGGGGGGPAAGMARSRAAKDLNVVLEAHATGTITAPGGAGAAGAQGRYSLRNGRTTSAGSVQPPANSPTKLPQSQRVLGKRDSVATPPVSGSGSGPESASRPGSGAEVGPGFDPAAAAAAAAAAGPGGTKGNAIVNGRNVRRRRSSMGGHETVNAG
ncbi:cell division control protein 14 [Rhodotorula sphaerocarpa]